MSLPGGNIGDTQKICDPKMGDSKMSDSKMSDSKASDSKTAYMYFKGRDSKKCFKIKKQALVLIPLLKTGIDTRRYAANGADESNPLILDPVIQTNEYLDNIQYELNTDDMLEIVAKYVAIWEDKPAAANYVKVRPVNSGYVDRILQTEDFKLIEEIVQKQLSKLPEDEQTKCSSIPMEKYQQTLDALTPVLINCDEYFHMTCLSNKINLYIACIIWNSSFEDLSVLLNNPQFKEVNQSFIDAWNKENADSIERMSELRTVGEDTDADINSLIQRVGKFETSDGKENGDSDYGEVAREVGEVAANESNEVGEAGNAYEVGEVCNIGETGNVGENDASDANNI